ncbi:hypothetical protein JHL21_05620 [Devosia sp. WQ 349]|uniref:hypothetical protein n=1 Tax=Devosia sp. WQ 349K1 TaxID=2800329 RepID=UPI0019042369|nr:hypothetical protein [Devosia sp. WQ 349K1]MBK1793973.1 hypothetical protein [Devosia sp. WQ 349K1]
MIFRVLVIVLVVVGLVFPVNAQPSGTATCLRLMLDATTAHDVSVACTPLQKSSETCCSSKAIATSSALLAAPKLAAALPFAAREIFLATGIDRGIDRPPKAFLS